MGRQLHKLSARTVAVITRPGRHSDGGGLYLFISRDSKAVRRRWVFRFAWQGKAREMGLGPASKVSLADARRQALAARSELAKGRDPIEARNTAKKAQNPKTFGDCALELIAAKEAEWRNAKHRWQWRQTLESFAAPLWVMPVENVALEDILGVLKPIWLEKAETASRLRGRIEAVLDYAKVHGLRESENPARWRGHLDKLLPKRQRLARGHHPAMPYFEIPAFMVALRQREAIAALALEFCILTAARSGEVLGARWDEIDLAAKVWTIPAKRMKAAREHRVPLSGCAMAILEKLAEARTGAFVFPSHRRGKPLSGMAMMMLLRRMNRNDVTVHGFRSAFRDSRCD
jgi:integrase